MGQSYTPQIIETPGGRVSLLEIEQRQAYPISFIPSVSITARHVLCNTCTVEGYHAIKKLTLNKVCILKPDSLNVQ